MESCDRVRRALALFRDLGAEMIINCGDVADHHSPEGYHCYRRTFNEVFPDASSRPKEVYTYAWHDVFNCEGGSTVAYEVLRRELAAPNGHTCDFNWRGLPFAVMPQDVGSEGFITWDEYEKMVARLCAENPGKPVFVCNHVPPQGTTYNSWVWGAKRSREILNRYPQVVVLSGHVHGSLASERQIWQGEFTVINAGCLQTWAGFAPGSTPPEQAKENYGVLVMDVYRDRLTVARFDIRDRSSCGPDWCVPLPFDASTAPYAPTRAAKRAGPRPAFAPDAALSVSYEKGRYVFRFPEATQGARAFNYVLSCERRTSADAWVRFTRDEMFGDFYRAPRERTGRAEYALSAGYFTSGETYRMTVTPQDAFTRASAPIVRTFTAEHAAVKTLWTLNEKDFTATEHGKPMPKVAGGFYAPVSGQGTLHLPAKLFAGLEKGRTYRLVVDLHTVQRVNEWCGWRVSLSSAADWRRTFAVVQTPYGDSGVLRYVMTFTPGNGFPADCNLVLNGVIPNGRIRPVSARLERP